MARILFQQKNFQGKMMIVKKFFSSQKKNKDFFLQKGIRFFFIFSFFKGKTQRYIIYQNTSFYI